MYKKIMKYELRRTRFILLLITAIAVVFAGLALAAAALSQVLSSMLLISVSAVFLAAIQIYLYIDFYFSLFSSKIASWTHLLPVSGRTLYFAKLSYQLLVNYAAMLFLVIVWVAYIAIFSIFEGPLQPPALSGNEIQQLIGAAVLVLASLAVSPLLNLTTMFAVIIVGGNGRIGRLGVFGPLLVYLGYMIVSQIVFFAVSLVSPQLDLLTWTLSDTTLLEQFKLAFQGVTPNSSGAEVPVIMLVLYPLLAVVAGWIGQHLLHRKLDLQT